MEHNSGLALHVQAHEASARLVRILPMLCEGDQYAEERRGVERRGEMRDHS